MLFPKRALIYEWVSESVSIADQLTAAFCRGTYALCSSAECIVKAEKTHAYTSPSRGPRVRMSK